MYYMERHRLRSLTEQWPAVRCYVVTLREWVSQNSHIFLRYQHANKSVKILRGLSPNMLVESKELDHSTFIFAKYVSVTPPPSSIPPRRSPLSVGCFVVRQVVL